MLPASLIEPDEREMRGEIEARTAARGHPWRSILSPDEIRRLADEAGFAEVSLVTADDLAARYFAERGDGLRPSSSAYLIASVQALKEHDVESHASVLEGRQA